MNQQFKSLSIVAVVAMALASCGPGNGEANVKVHVPGDSTTTPTDTVVEKVIVPPDTVVHRVDTTVISHVDTVRVPATPSVPPKVDTSRTTTPPASSVSADEKRKIDAWLAANRETLNQYGDPKDMMYTGATPLFNESTGQRIDKYDYIVSQHPDRPWMTSSK